MKRILYFIILLGLAVNNTAFAQDDNESILATDLEIDGFENFWIQSHLSVDKTCQSNNFKQAKPKGGVSAFLAHVHHFTSKLFSMLVSKYPDHMLAKVGSTAIIDIQFLIDEEGNTHLLSIRNGAPYGFDFEITKIMFSTYRKWLPAQINGMKHKSVQHLIIEVTI